MLYHVSYDKIEATRSAGPFALTFDQQLLRARRAGHGARARARLATDGSPVDSPSAEASGAESCLASPSRKRPAGRKKHKYTLLYKVPLRDMCHVKYRGVTQVEKGHEGNTALVTAYICWRKR